MFFFLALYALNMKNFIFLISFFISSGLYSQNEFIYKCETADFDYFVDLLVKNDSVIYLLGAQGYYDSTRVIYKSKLVEMDIAGNVLDSTYLSTYSEDVFLTKLKRIGNEIYAFGSAKMANGYGNIIIIYDSNFNEISRKKLLQDTTVLYKAVTDVLIIDTNIFIFNSDVYDIPPASTFSILKINTNLDSIVSFDAKPLGGTAYSAIDDKNGGIKVFTLYYKIISAGQIAHFDKNLNELSVDPLPHLLHFNNNSMWLTDTTFLVTGTAELLADSILPLYYNGWDLGIVVLDTNNNLLDYSIQIRLNGEENAGWFQNIVRSKTNGYYFVGNQNLGSHYNSKIILTKLDSAFNIIWEKTIWDRVHGFESFGIYTLSDSSVILLVEKYESLYSNYKDAYVYKISKDGAVLSTTNIGKQRIGKLNIFPNPGVDYINIATLGGVEQIVNYKIYDMQGKLVLSNNTFSNIVKVNTSHFKSGNYVVIANTLKGNVLSGKFIVEH